MTRTRKYAIYILHMSVFICIATICLVKCRSSGLHRIDLVWRSMLEPAPVHDICQPIIIGKTVSAATCMLYSWPSSTLGNFHLLDLASMVHVVLPPHYHCLCRHAVMWVYVDAWMSWWSLWLDNVCFRWGKVEEYVLFIQFFAPIKLLHSILELCICTFILVLYPWGSL